MSTSLRPRAGHALGFGQRCAAYVEIVRIQARTDLTYRSNFLFSTIGLLPQIFLLKMLWSAVFPDSGVTHVANQRPMFLSTQIAYSTLALLQFWLFNPSVVSTIPQRVREGQVAFDVARPVSFPTQAMLSMVGSLVAGAPFMAIVVPFALLIGGGEPPASPTCAVAYAVSLVPGYLVAVLTGTCVGMIAFWTLEISGILMIYQLTAQFFSGALVPLWIMPEWMGTLAHWMPFQATTFTPISIYLGQAGSASDMAASILLQCAWVAVLWLVLRVVWGRALHRIVVQGG